MNDKKDYFEQSISWANDTRAAASKSTRTAWTIAGIALGAAAFEAVALAMLAPLKTVQPITLLVDRQTGFVQSADPASPRRIAADEALTQAFLTQYISARESFDRATISGDYRKVALWSGGSARSSYLAEIPQSNPASPFNLYSPGSVVSVKVKSISKLADGVALVRFDTLLQDLNGRYNVAQPWISTVRYRYVDAPMSLDDRLVNPLGFQVLSYRRDAESLPASTEALPDQAASSTARMTAAAMTSEPAPPTARVRAGVMVNGRAVPADQVPSGSPLAGNAQGTGR